MSKKNNNKLKKWYNVNFVQIKVKKSKLEKFRENLQSDINLNSRVFFATLQNIEHQHVVDEHITTAENKTAKKSKGKKIFTICFFLLNIVLVALVLYNFAQESGGFQPLSTLIANNPKWSLLLIAVGLFVLTIIFNTLKFAILIYSRTKQFRPWFSFKLASIGRYYDFVTPLGSGGQPFEIYYLKKNGYSGDTATAIPLAKYMIWQVSFVFICLAILIAYSRNLISSPLVLICAWIGLSILLLLFLFVFLMSITKKWGASLVVGVLKLLHKMKIIKNYQKVLVKVLKFVKSYQYAIKKFTREPFTLLTEILVTILSQVSNALIAFFIYASFVDVPQISWWDMLCKCHICEVATSFFPMPGGSGAQELSFNALLGSLFPDGTLFWGVLFWRILTYYGYILVGGIALIGDSIHHKRKPPTAIPNIEDIEIPKKPRKSNN